MCIPSKRPPDEAERVLKMWCERGYKIALWREDMDFPFGVADDIRVSPEYPGYAKAVNLLIADVMRHSEDAEWFIAAGDDVEPDQNHSAEEIARECREHFMDQSVPYPKVYAPGEAVKAWMLSTFGVMQPTGDRWGDATGAYIDRVAGSAWIGREFARRVNQGNGPLWLEYTHQFVDQELQEVATRLGVFWQRPDLTQYHAHWGRPRTGEHMGMRERMPEFLKEANTAEHWQKYKALFAKRKAAGFPGSGPS